MTDEMLFAEQDRLASEANAEYKAGGGVGDANRYYMLWMSINRDALAAARARLAAKWEAEIAAAEAAETE